MTQKSAARLMRDAQHAKGPKAPPDAGNWDNMKEQNQGIAKLLMSTRVAVDLHRGVDKDLIQHSPTPELYRDAYKAVAKNFVDLSKEVVALKDKIGDRSGPVTDPNEAMVLLDVAVGQHEVLEKLDGVYRPSLAILQEQMNVARNIRSQKTPAPEQETAQVEQPTSADTSAVD